MLSGILWKTLLSGTLITSVVEEEVAVCLSFRRFVKFVLSDAVCVFGPTQFVYSVRRSLCIRSDAVCVFGSMQFMYSVMSF